MDYLVFDSFAFIALFRHEPGGETVSDYLLLIARGEAQGWMAAVNLGEVYYMMARKGNEKDAANAVRDILHLPVTIYEPDTDFCLQAARLKARYKISYADSFAAALTIEKKATLLTGDDEFDELKDVPGFKVKYL